MVRNYHKMTKRQSWSEEAIGWSIERVVHGEMGYRKVAVNFVIPHT